jgi:hypothetical protein
MLKHRSLLRNCGVKLAAGYGDEPFSSRSTNSALMNSSASDKLRYKKCLQVWGNASQQSWWHCHLQRQKNHMFSGMCFA